MSHIPDWYQQAQYALEEQWDAMKKELPKKIFVGSGEDGHLYNDEELVCGEAEWY